MPIDRDGAGRRWQPSTGGTDRQSADDRGPEMRLDEPAEGSSLAG